MATFTVPIGDLPKISSSKVMDSELHGGAALQQEGNEMGANEQQWRAREGVSGFILSE
jgi:hypothetical protein